MLDVTTDALDDIARELRLEPGEVLVLTLLQQVMIGRDVIGERIAMRQQQKARARDRFADAATMGHWARTEDLPDWARPAARQIADRVPSHQRTFLEEAMPRFGATLTRRSRALLVLIELYAFEPWPEGLSWVAKVRRTALSDIASHLAGLRRGDLDAVTAEYTAVLRALSRSRVRWGRLAAASALGIGLGVATAGAATPLIGAALGGAAGLSGAAATSAGLAALGGGSVAAGGFGVAGGTALLTGIGAITGAGVGAAGSRMSGWSSGNVVVDAVKLDVVTRLVLIDAEGDDAKARRVVEGLQARLDEVTTRIRVLGAEITRLRAENAWLGEENRRLREELLADQANAEVAGAALEVVIDRLPAVT